MAKKDADELRVIFDRRRRNAMEKSLEEIVQERVAGVDPCRAAYLLRLMALPHGAQLVDLLLSEDDELLVDVDDVSNMFYMLAWPAARWPENAVGDAIRP